MPLRKNLIPSELTKEQINFVYANEADVGNVRDYATMNQLICLSNMESLNAVFIDEKMVQSERLVKLNQIAIQQMKVLQEVENRKLLIFNQHE